MSNTTRNFLMYALVVVLGLSFVFVGMQKLAAGETMPPQFADINKSQFLWYLIGFAEMGLGVGLMVPGSRRSTNLLIFGWAVGAIGTLVVRGAYPDVLLYPALALLAGNTLLYFLLRQLPEANSVSADERMTASVG